MPRKQKPTRSQTPIKGKKYFRCKRFFLQKFNIVFTLRIVFAVYFFQKSRKRTFFEQKIGHVFFSKKKLEKNKKKLN